MIDEFGSIHASRFFGRRLHRDGRSGPERLIARDGGAAEWQAGRGLTHFAPKAKRVLQIFCPGAASHIDLWEHKPELEKRHGTPLPGEENLVSFQGKNGNLMKSPWPFAPAGESGKTDFDAAS